MAHADDYDQRAEHDHRRSHGTDRTTKTRKQKVAKIEISNSSAHTGNPRSEPATPCLNVEKRKANDRGQRVGLRRQQRIYRRYDDQDIDAETYCDSADCSSNTCSEDRDE